ncbi:MAG: prepilin peptidase [Candidatus Aenigmarchaeota archaeon]|nr:prepilin peptidase [Candidatus Aenigmarchaeota archaeon]
MLDLIVFYVGLFLSSVAAAWDLKTTEIPDEIPYAIAIIGIFAHFLYSLNVHTFMPLVYSLVFGFVFLVIGFAMYYTGQWGGGDAKLLTAIGVSTYMIPTKDALPFPLDFFVNLFLVGSVYIIFYSLVLSIRNKKIWKEFIRKVKEEKKELIAYSFGVFILVFLSSFIFYSAYGLKFNLDVLLFSFTMSVVAFCLIVLLKFGRVVEDVGFKKRIRVSQLKVGDVLAESKVWEGLSQEEIMRIKKSKRKYVWIKEGVRFAPAFPLALVATHWVGNLLLLIF